MSDEDYRPWSKYSTILPVSILFCLIFLGMAYFFNYSGSCLSPLSLSLSDLLFLVLLCSETDARTASWYHSHWSAGLVIPAREVVVVIYFFSTCDSSIWPNRLRLTVRVADLVWPFFRDCISSAAVAADFASQLIRRPYRCRGADAAAYLSANDHRQLLLIHFVFSTCFRTVLMTIFKT